MTLTRYAALAVAACGLAACDEMAATTTGDAPSVEAEAQAEASASAAPAGLSSSQLRIWNSFTPAGKQLVADCMAGGKSFATCIAP